MARKRVFALVLAVLVIAAVVAIAEAFARRCLPAGGLQGVSTHPVLQYDEALGFKCVPGLEQRLRHSERRGHAEGIAQPRHILDGGEALHAGERHRHGASAFDEVANPLRVRSGRAGLDVVFRQRPEVTEQVVELVGRADLPVRCKVLQLEFDGRDDVGVEEIPEFGFSQELA